ncbi:MAG: DUF4293 domain-containing protein [Saprospiraceae bacterium]
MIQRIQTVFLLLGGVFMLAVLFFPFVSVKPEVPGAGILMDGVYTAREKPVLAGLFFLSGVLAFIGIFLFKNRSLQMKMAIFSADAGFLGIVLAIFYLWQDEQVRAIIGAIRPDIGALLPVAGFVALLLAFWYIRKDEKLVRSMDRLR